MNFTLWASRFLSLWRSVKKGRKKGASFKKNRAFCGIFSGVGRVLKKGAAPKKKGVPFLKKYFPLLVFFAEARAEVIPLYMLAVVANTL